MSVTQSVHSDCQQELYNSLAYKLCKVPPQMCDASTIILTFLVVVEVECTARTTGAQFVEPDQITQHLRLNVIEFCTFLTTRSS